MNKFFLIIPIVFLLITKTELFSQIKGESGKKYNPDTVFVFTSPRPLVIKEDLRTSINNASGLDLSISESGFGVGYFYNHFLSENLLLFANISVGGIRASDEFESFNYITQEYQVENKINRLFRFPMNIGINYLIFNESLESIKPYFTIGLGPTFVLSTPYTENREANAKTVNWFSAFGDGIWYTRLGTSLGFGAYFGNMTSTMFGVSIKYYYTPFGDDGIESVQGLPIRNVGGIYLGLTVGSTN